MTVATTVCACDACGVWCLSYGCFHSISFSEGHFEFISVDIFHSFLNGKMGITQSSQMTLSGFCVHENIQSSLDAIKTATQTSVLLKMRQQLIFLENESYTSCSMAKP